jgi:hypothetical protein
VEVNFDHAGICLLCETGINNHSTPNPIPVTRTLQQVFETLPQFLKKLYGCVSVPSDNGHSLIRKLNSKGTPLYGASDALLKDGSCSHAWIMSTGDVEDIKDLLLSITGSGAMDGTHMTYQPHEVNYKDKWQC